MPDLNDGQRSRYLPGLRRLLADQADDHQAWQPITWVVGGERISAWVWKWAGGWAAFATAVPEVAIAAVGAGLSPDGLTLVEVRDGSAYHFDVGAPVEFPGTLEESARAALNRVADDDDPAWPWHEDQLQLLESQP